METSGRRLKSYTGARRDLIEQLPDVNITLPVLDVGCSNGATGRVLKERFGVEVIGVESDRRLSEEAARHLDRVVVSDAVDALDRLRQEQMRVGAVLFGDVLEHLVDPWTCVDHAIALMPTGGWMVASVPNVGHVDTVWNLLRGTWPMRDRGLHDHSHLRFFARRDLQGLFARDRTEIESVRRVYRIIERPHRFNRRAHLIGWLWPNLFTYQFHVLVAVHPPSR